MDETPLPKLPSGFEVTPPLVSFDSSDSSSGSDSDSSDSDSSDSDQPLWAPVPRYEYVEYTTQAIPYEGQPFEVAPLLRDWEDSEVNNRKLEDASAVAMTYQANSDDDEEKIREEQEWRDKNMISRRALDGLDPGREFSLLLLFDFELSFGFSRRRSPRFRRSRLLRQLTASRSKGTRT